ncbi:MAG: ABC transporter permease, partial [Burkholderiaceae bacterium]
PWFLFDPHSLESTGNFLKMFIRPETSAEFLWRVAHATWITIATATAGLALGWIAAVPMTLACSARLSQSSVGRPMGWWRAALRQLIRWILVFLRSVPELVWALLFVRVVGLGPTAGVLAIGLTYSGMLGKVYSEVLESVDGEVTESLLRNGASRIGAFFYGALPQCATELTSYTVFRWECAVRSSVVMGFVGAGGLGQELDFSMKMFAGNEVATILIMFMVLVAIADKISTYLRRHLEFSE